MFVWNENKNVTDIFPTIHKNIKKTVSSSKIKMLLPYNVDGTGTTVIMLNKAVYRHNCLEIILKRNMLAGFITTQRWDL